MVFIVSLFYFSATIFKDPQVLLNNPAANDDGARRGPLSLVEVDHTPVRFGPVTGAAVDRVEVAGIDGDVEVHVGAFLDLEESRGVWICHP